MDRRLTEDLLLKRPLPELLPAEEGWVLPHYDQLSIANIPATISELLGSRLPDALPTLPRALWASWKPALERVVLVILDGLGYGHLERMWDMGEGQVLSELAEAGWLVPLTSVFPSTTDAALISLATGRPPAEHGWLAYELYLRELGMAINAVLLCPMQTRKLDLLLEWGVDAASLVKLPTLAQCLAAAGVSAEAVLPAGFRASGFTRMVYGGFAHLRGHRTESDFWLQLRQALADTRGSSALIAAYWGGLDTIGHEYGPAAPHWDAEFRSVCHMLKQEFLARLPARDRDGTLLLLTADHGMIHIPPDQILTADEDIELHQHLQVPVTGESRAAFVYPRPGRKSRIRSHLTESYPGWFAVLESRDALDAGLMGQPVIDDAYARAGELLVLPRRDHALQSSRPKVSLIGRHGGLTRDEMLVPLVGARLDALDV